DAQAVTPDEDKVAVLQDLPEALLSSVPPTLKAIRPSGPELDASVQLPPPMSEDLARRVREWSFNLHDVPKEELPELCFNVLLCHEEFNTLNVNKKRLWRYVQEIARRYRNNPFHSFRHAVDVTICCGCLVRMIQAAYHDVLSDPQVRPESAHYPFSAHELHTLRATHRTQHATRNISHPTHRQRHQLTHTTPEHTPPHLTSATLHDGTKSRVLSLSPHQANCCVES
ncbi:MAG: hypothetical protein SGPRY_005887, partial [Prymnesium sp.]